MTPVTIIDVETLPLPMEQMFKVPDDCVPLGNVKDPAKVTAKIAEFHSEWVESAALRPETGQVAMFGSICDGKVSILDGDEKKILADAIKLLTETIVFRNEIVAGFCICDFDLPFLIRRAWVHGLKMQNMLRSKRWWSDNIIDLRDVWLLGNRSPVKGTTTLDAVAAQLGLPPKLGKGEDFEKMSPNMRTSYLTRDLEITEALYKRLCA